MKKTLAVTASVALAAAGSFAAMPASAQPTSASVPETSAPSATTTAFDSSAAPYQSVDEVRGAFSFDQSTTSSNDTISSCFAKAASVLCAKAVGGEFSGTGAIVVGGDVGNPMIVNLEAIDPDTKASNIIGCSCASNGAGGGAMINAEVEGVSIMELWRAAEPKSDATEVEITFADGSVEQAGLMSMMQKSARIGLDAETGESVLSMAGADELAQAIESIDFVAA